jgi:signal transduction histidine kinase
MNRRLAITLAWALLCSGFGLSDVTAAQLTGTAAEARAMLQKAVTELKVNPATALAKFNQADGGFRDRDLYVFCFEMGSGKLTAHVNPALLGTDVRALEEKDGSPLGQKIYNVAKEGTVTTIDYNFPRPGGTAPVPKEAYVTRVGDQGCGVGYYK